VEVSVGRGFWCRRGNRSNNMVSWSPEASSQNNGACSGTPPRTLHLGQVFHRFCTPIRSPCFGGHEKLITPLRSSVRGLENPIRQPRFGLPEPLVPYHRPAPVAAASGKAVEHISLGQRVLTNGVSYSPTVGRLPKGRRHYRLPVVGPVLVEMGRGVARVQQPLLRSIASAIGGPPFGPRLGVFAHHRGFLSSILL
jgi:hypothetical protein